MKRRIVIADDDPAIVTLVSSSLQADRYEVFAGSNGAEALSHIRRHRPHAAILDIRMPGTDGVAALEEIKADPALSAIPVMMLTGERNPEIVMQALSCGAADYMVKPFHPDTLVERVERMIRNAPAGHV